MHVRAEHVLGMHLAQCIHCKCTQIRMYNSNFIWHLYEQPDEHRWGGDSGAQQATHKTEGRMIILSISKMCCSIKHIMLDSEAKDMPNVSHRVARCQGASVTFTDLV